MTPVPRAQQDPARPETAVRQTRFKDVCGSIDELKRVLYEEPERAATDTGALESLVDDALYMLARMELRLAEYEAFRRTVQTLAAELQHIGGSPRADGIAAAQALRRRLPRGRPLAGEAREAAVASAEAIREAARDVEQKLSRYKALALELERAYRRVKGDRVWVLDEAEAARVAALPGEPAWSRWLPPSPHRERILRLLQSGGAHLLTEEELIALRGEPPRPNADEPPLVQFGDGGVIALPRVRWSDELRNFYAADDSETPPHPGGLRYRDYAGPGGPGEPGAAPPPG
jgi:hypothetical protein